MYNQIDSNKRDTFILISVFLLFIIIIAWIIDYYYNISWIIPLALFISLLQVWVGYYYSDRITLSISGAKEINHDDFPELYHIVENLCIAGGLPMPRIYIIEDSAPNAFATGRDPKNAVICVTRGLLDKLNRSELEGVIAHELSHIGNYDILIMTVVVVLVGLVALISDIFLRNSMGFRSKDNDSENNRSAAVFQIIALLFIILSPIIANLIKLAISRKREYLADANGALLTRYPEGLASALEKISADTEPLEAANKATAHLYITNPLKEHSSFLNNMFDTHPPAEERIKRLRGMLS
jgi:heat shock protein HtpX